MNPTGITVEIIPREIGPVEAFLMRITPEEFMAALIVLLPILFAYAFTLPTGWKRTLNVALITADIVAIVLIARGMV